ncbi:MAG: NUDIX domain-containing protein [Bacteroidetes bacterium]|nr:NUDIX domain-containing protein [Bacteroidota bacterium]
MIFTIRVYGILINDNNQILVSDEFIRGNYFTKFPGGGLEFGEGTRDCVKREFKEETGLDVVVEEHLYTTDFFQISAFNPQHQIVSIYYYVSCLNADNLPTKHKQFDFEPNQIADNTSCAEVFRWIDLNSFYENDVHLPIDKIVANLILASQKS